MSLIIPNWKAPKNVKAIASTRLDGFSTGVYQGLNLGSHVGDDLDTVLRNRQQLAQMAKMPSAPVWLNQTHSTVVAQVNQPTKQTLDADGLVTSQSGVVLSAMTADCLPVLLTNTQGTQVAAVHAGWRGLADGIVENALMTFDADLNRGNVIAWLGPAIGATAFEVGEDVLQAFCDADSQAIDAFRPTGQVGKWWANMELLATQRLNALGVTQVFASGLCTYSDPERFYSYRRDGVTGRLASFIWIE
ncbi:multicopper polyphenol oxidase [Vibrio ichthyoenteri ATCC 700023]|uniref:Purine nucleoside phosphorylase n=1 Tax=Vibrio ichthyoenteri ATCC 700023 TaxID=870968 RepID=F9S3X9_9VIBR|nr:peptidoglycan editing factor PgeF [Vibrio ichthyoenteri]EGU37590.1 multicopper polyphenol oxidase [Vibrio ichthyoenteri ATCC 700023]